MADKAYMDKNLEKIEPHLQLDDVRLMWATALVDVIQKDRPDTFKILTKIVNDTYDEILPSSLGYWRASGYSSDGGTALKPKELFDKLWEESLLFEWQDKRGNITITPSHLEPSSIAHQVLLNTKTAEEGHNLHWMVHPAHLHAYSLCINKNGTSIWTGDDPDDPIVRQLIFWIRETRLMEHTAVDTYVLSRMCKVFEIAYAADPKLADRY